MLITYLLFAIGFVLLIKGADWLVKGAASIAKKFNISDIAIGLTIVSVGTSMPELIVNVFASLQGNSGIAIGNVLGSNVANILLILGISAIIYPLRVLRPTILNEIPYSLFAVLLFAVFANTHFLQGGTEFLLSRGEAFVLLFFFLVFLAYVFKMASDSPEPDEEIVAVKPLTAILLIIIGITGLAVGGKWIVDGAVAIASLFGVSEVMIGLTIVAVGTSLPELATSAVAAFKKNTDIAVGNVVGSNIFNILWILGVSGAIKPLPFTEENNFDVVVVAIVTTLLFAVLFIPARHEINRWKGIMFLFFYACYIAFLIWRG